MGQINIRTVEMVRSIRDAHYEQLKDRSRHERILFHREKAGRLHDRLFHQKNINQPPAPSRPVSG
ncbi:MAG TPA: hypothetical protein ENK58_09840 [Desulfobacterales bacterium]|nr:MAG: hypothetical protein DRI57_09650 [Deltaproteobacteria bacterium]HHC25689.1 hypothetical protein [Desulfobacterales bacterium]